MMRKPKREDFLEYGMLHKWPYWLSALIVGLVAVGYSRIVSTVESLSKSLYEANPEYLLVVAPLLFIVSWALVFFFAPEAKGSGIPQVMASIEILEHNESTETVNHLLGPRIAFIKMLSSSLLLLGGGAIGREGPTLQISASIFYYVSKKFQFIKRYISVETWVLTGAAAGLAAAFNTPLGGLVYAIEELATQHLNKFKSSLITAVIIAGFSSQIISGPYLYLGYPKLSDFDFFSIPLVILISVLCGVLGALFGRMIFKITKLKSLHLKSVKILMIFSGLCGLVTAAIAIYIDQRFMGSGKELLMDFLFKEGSSEWHLPFLRFFAPILTYASGGAGGIFAPSLAAGGSIGHFIAGLTSTSNTNLFTLLGMIAFLTGVTRAPFTAFILVLEMTDRHSSILPMMLAAMLAHSAARIVGSKSFYELLKETYFPKPQSI